jgi:hypothetical protein
MTGANLSKTRVSGKIELCLGSRGTAAALGGAPSAGALLRSSSGYVAEASAITWVLPPAGMRPGKGTTWER